MGEGSEEMQKRQTDRKKSGRVGELREKEGQTERWGVL